MVDSLGAKLYAETHAHLDEAVRERGAGVMGIYRARLRAPGASSPPPAAELPRLVAEIESVRKHPDAQKLAVPAFAPSNVPLCCTSPVAMVAHDHHVKSSGSDPVAGFHPLLHPLKSM